MKLTLKLEAISQLSLSIFLYFFIFKFSWVYFLIFLFIPDLSIIGYALGNKSGAYVYNTVHNLVLPTVTFTLGLLTQNTFFLMPALILFTHIFMDRTLGYGLKYPDSFQHTHLQ
ncbi:DUF4260 domain-containing protein [Enterococcus termitis]|nr:DUF4260 domain-containing protein [Enterococcus termitis]OJG99558.1 hypothetical protein RV18_GL001626 [Enterococcus termitis]